MTVNVPYLGRTKAAVLLCWSRRADNSHSAAMLDLGHSRMGRRLISEQLSNTSFDVSTIYSTTHIRVQFDSLCGRLQEQNSCLLWSLYSLHVFLNTVKSHYSGALSIKLKLLLLGSYKVLSDEHCIWINLNIIQSWINALLTSRFFNS